MKPLTLDEIYEQLNELLLFKKLIKEPIDFEELTVCQSLSIIFEACKFLEHKLYNKGQKRSGIYLRKIYTLCEKMTQHEKKKIQEFKYEELNDRRVILTEKNKSKVSKNIKYKEENIDVIEYEETEEDEEDNDIMFKDDDEVDYRDKYLNDDIEDDITED